MSCNPGVISAQTTMSTNATNSAGVGGATTATGGVGAGAGPETDAAVAEGGGAGDYIAAAELPADLTPILQRLTTALASLQQALQGGMLAGGDGAPSQPSSGPEDAVTGGGGCSGAGIPTAPTDPGVGTAPTTPSDTQGGGTTDEPGSQPTSPGNQTTPGGEQPTDPGTDTEGGADAGPPVDQVPPADQPPVEEQPPAMTPEEVAAVRAELEMLTSGAKEQQQILQSSIAELEGRKDRIEGLLATSGGGAGTTSAVNELKEIQAELDKARGSLHYLESALVDYAKQLEALPPAPAAETDEAAAGDEAEADGAGPADESTDAAEDAGATDAGGADAAPDADAGAETDGADADADVEETDETDETDAGAGTDDSEAASDEPGSFKGGSATF